MNKAGIAYLLEQKWAYTLIFYELQKDRTHGSPQSTVAGERVEGGGGWGPVNEGHGAADGM